MMVLINLWVSWCNIINGKYLQLVPSQTNDFSSFRLYHTILSEDDIFIYADSVEETTSNSEVAESSPPNVQPIIPKYLESSTESSSSSAYGNSVDRAPSLCIAVVGATGELARNKIFPALFALYYSGFLPEV